MTHAGLTVESIAELTQLPKGTVSGFFSGQRIPVDIAIQRQLLEMCGVRGEQALTRWLSTLQDVRAGRFKPAYPRDRPVSPRARKTRTIPEAEVDDSRPGLLFRVYIPATRLYAAEAGDLVDLFRQWLGTVRGQGVRQEGYRTASGEVIELFTNAPLTSQDRQEMVGDFSRFLTLCSADPSAAADMLASTQLGRAASTDFVARFGKEVRRLQIDLAHERERRILDIRHALEAQLVDAGIELAAIPTTEINALIEAQVPRPSGAASLALMAGPPKYAVPPVTLTINQQYISAVQSTIVASVQGSAHLGPQAKEVLEFIDRFGGNETAALATAVHELEDKDAPTDKRSVAKRRLAKFLGQLTGTARDIGLDLLKKYLESKLGV